VQFRFSDDAEKDAAAHHVFFRELYRRGIFAARPFLLSYAHQDADIDETLAAMEEALLVVVEEVFSARSHLTAEEAARFAEDLRRAREERDKRPPDEAPES